ncbi:MAG: DoxX family membrane protein [Flavobacteriaceae bacterium]|nr:DoxX family membrane protein [Flavobacteriaceae bacterium]
MKFLVQLVRVFVGVLFILSGWVKLNDPMGFSFKLEEYFSPGVFDWSFLLPYTLELSLFVVIFEILLGVFLLLGYKPKFTIWSLLLMILFFTGLTFYSAYYNVVTDCGCFGDAVKLTPWESFTKDVVLLVLILFMLFGIKYIKPILSQGIRVVVAGLSLIGCVAYAYQVLEHLPSVDFRPYKIGTNIEEGMQIPEGAEKDETAYHWKFKQGDEETIITTNGDYPEVDGEFVSVETELLSKGYEPPIHDFTIENDGVDKTELMMEEDHLVMVISHDILKSDRDAFKKVKEFTDDAILKGYKVIGMSASSAEVGRELKGEYALNYPYYFTDQTTLKTIVRSNPGVLILEKGTIVDKKHHNDLHLIYLDALPNANTKLDLDMKRQLDSIFELDQKYRNIMGHAKTQKAKDSLWELQSKIDESNLAFVENLIAKNGYPGKSQVGVPTNKAAWYVIQHSNKIAQYLDVLKQSGQKGEFPFTLVATMEDRYLKDQNKEQLYGTQIGSVQKEGAQIRFVWPVKDAHYVNERRKEAGFIKSLEEYSSSLGFTYEPISLEKAIKLIENKN